MASRSRKVTATIMFTDLVSSTPFVERAGDDRAERIFSTHRRLLAEAAAAHDGHVVKEDGDGLMAMFRSATEALAAAVEMQEAARHPIDGELLGLRVGLNTGDIVEDGDDYFGIHIVVAQRLGKVGPAGSVLCSESVVALLSRQSDFAFEDLGPLSLKGIANPVRAFTVRPRERSIADRLVRMPLVGRGREVDRIQRVLDDLAGGRGSVLLLTGEPGIGKTRLAEEVEALARQRGALTAWVRCYPGDGDGAGAAPVAALAQAIEAVTSQPVPGDRADVRGMASLVESTATVVVVAASHSPVVIFFDDLQWAGAETAAVFRHLARLAPRNRLVLVATWWDGEVDPSRPVWDAIAALPRETKYETVALTGLTAAELTEFLAVLDEREAPGLVDALARHTGGNPYFVREVLLNLGDPKNEWHWPPASDALAVTPGMRQMLLRRVEQLSPAARQLLTVAATFESQFNLAWAAETTGLDERAALDGVDEALRAQLIRPSGGVDSYEMSHWIIRQALRESLSPSRLARLHREVAGVLERAGAGLRLRAFHLRKAGEAANSAAIEQTCLAAGDEAIVALAYDEAIANFEAALTAAEVSNNVGVRAEASYGLARAHAELERRGEALAKFQEAHYLHRLLGNSARVAEGLYFRARLHLFQFEMGEAQNCLSEAREVLLDANDVEERERNRILARTLELTGQMLARTGRLDEASELQSEAMVLAEQLGQPGLLAEVLFARGWIRLQRLEVDAAVADFRRYSETAIMNRYPVQELAGATRGGAALVFSGDLDRARELATPAQERSLKSGRSRDEAIACIPLAAVAALRAELDVAEAHAARGLAIDPGVDPFHASSLIPIRACVASMRGDHRQALRLIDPLLTPEERAGRPRAIVNGFGLQALLMGLAGDIAASRLMTLAMAERLRPRRPDLRSLPTYVVLGELALMHREVAVAELVFEQLAALQAEGLKVAPGWPVAIARLLGGLSTLRGDAPAAREWLNASLEWSRTSRAVVEEALTEFELARTHDGEALQHIERGNALAAHNGLPGLSSRSPAAAPTG
jgi:class 3 adenylate cyclase/tetratricopeptide (TPR) repeat protein